MKVTWTPTSREKESLKCHSYVRDISCIDSIWPYLAEKYGAITALDAPHLKNPERYSFSELSRLISTSASAFQHQGLKKGEVVALFAENSPRWLVVDQGLMRLGAANAVRGASAPIEELIYILKDCKATGLVVQNIDLLKRLSLTFEQRSKLRFVLQLEGESKEGVLDWETFLISGIEKEGIESSNSEDSIATILYTSGTTGRPKGVPLTHGNILHQIRSLACVAYPPPGSPVLSVLPIWHAYERSASYYFLSCACSQTYTTIKHLKKDLPRVRPIAMATVPRLWEAIQIGFEDFIQTLSPPLQTLLRGVLANSVKQRHSWRKARGIILGNVSKIERVQAIISMIIRWPLHALASALLWPKIRSQLSGGQLSYPISGGGAIAPHVDSFFEAIGIEILVGYGLTETGPVVSCRRPWRNIRGSSGLPMPETEFRIVDLHTRNVLGFDQTGLILVRGPQVMGGYLGRQDATVKVLDEDGWLDTGDLGMLLADSSVVLTGRAKDTIVLNSGENIEPGPLEEAILSSPLIEQIMLVGQDERGLGGLIVPKQEKIQSWACELGFRIENDLENNNLNTELLKMLMRECNRLLENRSGSRRNERLIGVMLVKPFSIENGLLTHTLKQRREQITKRDNFLIKRIYESRC